MTDYSRKSSNFADKKSATSSSQGIENTNSLQPPSVPPLAGDRNASSVGCTAKVCLYGRQDIKVEQIWQYQ